MVVFFSEKNKMFITFSIAYLEKDVCSLSINSIWINSIYSNDRCKIKKQMNFERESALFVCCVFFLQKMGVYMLYF